VSDDRFAAVDAYIQQKLLDPDPVLDAALAAAHAAGLPEIDVEPTLGRFLELLARIQGARRILEIGTLAGYSTIHLARGMGEGGRLITLEVSPEHAAVAGANLRRAGLADVAEVRVGAALDLLPELEGDAPFDLVFVDADKVHTAEYVAWALRLSRPGTVIVADNVVRGGRVADPAARDPSVEGIRRFYDLVAAEPRLAATAIQTVSAKAYDGFALLVVSD
jgi:predicted O-methyltransferase YrrM